MELRHYYSSKFKVLLAPTAKCSSILMLSTFFLLFCLSFCFSLSLALTPSHALSHHCFSWRYICIERDIKTMLLTGIGDDWLISRAHRRIHTLTSFCLFWLPFFLTLLLCLVSFSPGLYLSGFITFITLHSLHSLSFLWRDAEAVLIESYGKGS